MGRGRPSKRGILREPSRANQALGRDGEVITRDVNYDDQFYIPEEATEEGWSYQWCRESVFNKEDTAEMIAMHKAGWRSVPPERLGLSKSDDGCIRRGGLILMERPQSLTDQANREDQEAASRQLIQATSRVDTNMKLSDGHRPMARRVRKEKRERIDGAMKMAMSDMEIPME